MKLLTSLSVVLLLAARRGRRHVRKSAWPYLRDATVINWPWCIGGEEHIWLPQPA